MNERIKELRKKMKLSQDDFAKKIGLTKNYISLVETGNRNLSEQSVKLLCHEFNVNENWLRTGEGEQYTKKSKDEEIAEMLADVQLAGEDTFKHRLISALAQLDEDGWKVIENFIDSVSGSNKAGD